MLDELLKEIEELKEYKMKNIHIQKDNQTMSDELFKLMLEKYESLSYEKRVEIFKKEWCHRCRFDLNCAIEIPQDILKPLPSDIAWMPPTRGCGSFEWS